MPPTCLYPSRHEQVYPPGVFSHSWSHWSVPSAHSSMSSHPGCLPVDEALPSPRKPKGHWHLKPRKVSTHAENSGSPVFLSTSSDFQHPPLLADAHSLTSRAGVRHAGGSEASEKPAQSPRVTDGASSLPRYCAPLMTTVGVMSTREEVPPPSPCASRLDSMMADSESLETSPTQRSTAAWSIPASSRASRRHFSSPNFPLRIVHSSAALTENRHQAQGFEALVAASKAQSCLLASVTTSLPPYLPLKSSPTGAMEQ